MHMPGHKGGRGVAQVLLDFLGEASFQADLTEVPGLDDLHQARGPIGQAQKLAAGAFGAEQTFFLVNGASTGIHGALLALAGPGDRVFLPRHLHRSVFAGLVMAGAEPVYRSSFLSPGAGYAPWGFPGRLGSLLGQASPGKGSLFC
ncbi:MAG: hypothetical protein ACOX37_01095 [Bacillota bacterium]